MPGASLKITPTAGTVLVVAHGGNTDTGVRPAGTSDSDSAKVGLGAVVKPPPPGVPVNLKNKTISFELYFKGSKSVIYQKMFEQLQKK